MTVQLFTVPSLVGLMFTVNHHTCVLWDVHTYHTGSLERAVSLESAFPSLQSRMLVTEHGLLSKIIGTLLEVLSPCRDPGMALLTILLPHTLTLSLSRPSDTGILKLRSSNYKHSRVIYILYDLR